MVGKKTYTPATGSQHAAPFQAKHFSSIARWLSLHNALWLGHPGLPTLPWATSSLWAAEADLTRALVAAAMDLAASKICSSKSRVSSACYKGKETKSNAHVQPQGALSAKLLTAPSPGSSGVYCFLLISHTQGREASPSAASPPLPLESKSC